MWSRPQYTDLTYMGGTKSCGPMRISLGSVIKSYYTSLNIKFGANWTLHVLKTPVYRFEFFERYHLEVTLWLAYKLEQGFPCAQDPSIPIGFIWEVPDPANRYSPIPTSVRLIQA